MPTGLPVACALLAAIIATALRRTAPVRRLTSPPPLSVEIPAAAIAAAFALVTGPRFELAGFVVVAAVGCLLAATDLAANLLPDALTKLGMAALLASYAAGAVLEGDAERLLGGLAGAAALGAVYLALAVLGQGRLGLGDVKLAALLGLVLGWFGPAQVLLGSFATFAIFAIVTLVLLASRRVRLDSELPFGPFMLAAAGGVVAFQAIASSAG